MIARAFPWTRPLCSKEQCHLQILTKREEDEVVAFLDSRSGSWPHF